MAAILRQNSLVAITDDTAYAEFYISDESDLNDLTAWGSSDLADGCIAWCITTGAWYGLAGGTWYNQDGSGAVNSNNSSLGFGFAPVHLGMGNNAINENNDEVITNDQDVTENAESV